MNTSDLIYQTLSLPFPFTLDIFLGMLTALGSELSFRGLFNYCKLLFKIFIKSLCLTVKGDWMNGNVFILQYFAPSTQYLLNLITYSVYSNL